VSEEFFTEGDSLTEISALVRESMQNSLDAAQDKSMPITMRFKIGEQMPTINHDYFDSIYRHAELSLQPNLLPKLNYKSKFLVIEDFNTAGLKGSISSLRPSPESSEKYGDNFWFFEWKSGETNKLRGGRGSWGIGKAVLSAASRMKTILVYSERDRASSPKPNTESILFGHSIFKYANIDGKRLKPHRNWMKEVQVEGHSGEIDFEPTSLISDLELFRRDWKIKRKSGEVGTSIVIPFIKDTITADSLIQCIIQDYFIAILDDSVICEVEDENGNEFLIDKENIFVLIDRIEEVNSSSTTKSKRELVGVCQMYENWIKNQTFKYIIWGVWCLPLCFLFLLFGKGMLIWAIVYTVVITLSEIFAMPFMMNYALSKPSKERQGQYSALYSIAYGVANIAAPSVGLGIADRFGFDTMFYVLIIISLICCLGFYSLKKKEIIFI
jgi:hypothetical protein